MHVLPLVLSPSITVTEKDVQERFIRSSGPGGQNVNKVSSAVELRFDVGQSPLSDEIKARLRELAGARLTAADVLVIDAREHRTQSQNRLAARERLAALLRAAATRPRRRRASKPTQAAKERRVIAKKRRGVLKRRRSSSNDD